MYKYIYNDETWLSLSELFIPSVNKNALKKGSEVFSKKENITEDF